MQVEIAAIWTFDLLLPLRRTFEFIRQLDVPASHDQPAASIRYVPGSLLPDTGSASSDYHCFLVHSGLALAAFYRVLCVNVY